MKTYTCGHCGRDDVGTFFAGYAWAYGHYLCHPNLINRPDCYHLVTVYKHPMNHRLCDGRPYVCNESTIVTVNEEREA